MSKNEPGAGSRLREATHRPKFRRNKSRSKVQWRVCDHRHDNGRSAIKTVEEWDVLNTNGDKITGYRDRCTLCDREWQGINVVWSAEQEQRRVEKIKAWVEKSLAKPTVNHTTNHTTNVKGGE